MRTKTGNPFRWFVGDKMGTATRAEQELYGDQLEPSDEHLAANAYEAMVFCATGRGLTLPPD